MGLVLLLGEVPLDKFVEENFLGCGDGPVNGCFGIKGLDVISGSGEAIGEFTVAIGASATVEGGAQGEKETGRER
jgi:hypothetical protein